MLFYCENQYIYCNDNILNNDTVLLKIKELIPQNWKLLISKNEIIFEREGFVWALFENKINAPVDRETDKEKTARIKKYGKKIKTKLVYKYEERWSIDKIKLVKEHNQKIYKKISILMDKYKIRHLFDNFASSKGGEYFKQGTPDENKRIEEYHKDKLFLENRIVGLPEYNTDKLSLFNHSGSGYNDMYTTVYPFEATMEAFKIINLVSENSYHVK